MIEGQDPFPSLLERAESLSRDIREYARDHLAGNPVAAHAAAIVDSAVGQLYRGVADAAERAERRRVRDERQADWLAEQAKRTEKRDYDEHTLEMAKRLGMTPAEFLELQEKRRADMARVAAKGSIDQQLADVKEEPR